MERCLYQAWSSRFRLISSQRQHVMSQQWRTSGMAFAVTTSLCLYCSSRLQERLITSWRCQREISCPLYTGDGCWNSIKRRGLSCHRSFSFLSSPRCQSRFHLLYMVPTRLPSSTQLLSAWWQTVVPTQSTLHRAWFQLFLIALFSMKPQCTDTSFLFFYLKTNFIFLYPLYTPP